MREHCCLWVACRAARVRESYAIVWTDGRVVERVFLAGLDYVLVIDDLDLILLELSDSVLVDLRGVKIDDVLKVAVLVRFEETLDSCA